MVHDKKLIPDLRNNGAVAIDISYLLTSRCVDNCLNAGLSCQNEHGLEDASRGERLLVNSLGASFPLFKGKRVDL